MKLECTIEGEMEDILDFFLESEPEKIQKWVLKRAL
jgi:hypothetical protein